MLSLSRILRREDGAATVAFVIYILPILALTFFAIELGTAYLLSVGVKHASYRAARLAAVRAPAAPGVPDRNQKSAAGLFGKSCKTDCVAPDPAVWICDGASPADCDAATFTAITDEISRFSPIVEDRYVVVRYEYTGLGYAGGPLVPRVTVTIRNPDRQDGMIPGPLAFTSLLSFWSGQQGLSVTPGEASVSGEDLTTNY